MTREVNNTRCCIECGAEVPRKVKRCPECNEQFLRRRPTYVRTPEHRQRMSAALQGKPKSYPTGGSLPGVAAKIRLAWTPEMRGAARRRGSEFALDPKWRSAVSSPGVLNPRWEGGRSGLPYRSGFSATIRRLVRERDGGCCRQCGSTKNLCVHHRDFSKTNHSLDNLILVCRKCHTRIHLEEQRRRASVDLARRRQGKNQQRLRLSHKNRPSSKTVRRHREELASPP